MLSSLALFLDLLEVVWNLEMLQPSSRGRRDVNVDPCFCFKGSRVRISSLLMLDSRSSWFRGWKGWYGSLMKRPCRGGEALYKASGAADSAPIISEPAR